MIFEGGKHHEKETLVCTDFPVPSCAESSASDFTISCNAETFAALSADDFALLHVLEARCGIAQAELRYSESGRTFLFDHVVYDRFPYAECADEAAVQQAVSRFAESRTAGFRLLLTPELCQTLYASGGLHMVAARCGMDDLSAAYALSAGILSVKDIHYSEVPYTFCADAQTFLSTVESMAHAGIPAFHVCLSSDFFQQLDSHADMLNQLLLSSCLDHYYYSKDSLQKTLSFSEVTYTFEPRMICHTEEDIVAAIRNMGITRQTGFMLILDEALYDTVSRNSFQRLHTLEGEAGLSWCSLSYSSENNLLLYADAVIHADAVQLSSFETLCAYLLDQAAACPSEITLFLIMPCSSRMSRIPSRLHRLSGIPAQSSCARHGSETRLPSRFAKRKPCWPLFPLRKAAIHPRRWKQPETFMTVWQKESPTRWKKSPGRATQRSVRSSTDVRTVTAMPTPST